MKTITAAFRSILNWFEHGDLVPLIVLVSAIHYAAILRTHDNIFAAVSIGTLVDLGHYRWTKAAVRYTGENNWERFGRWVMVLVMSAIALNYQQRFYNDWWLSVPLPLLIASLAWLNQKESKNKPAISQLEPAKIQRVAKVEPIAPAIQLIKCDHCPREFATQSALNAHQRTHKPNGAGRADGKE